MLGRKKQRSIPPPAAPAGSLMPGQQESMRVLQAFLASPGGAHAGMASPAVGYNPQILVGPETAPGAGPPMAGSGEAAQLQRAFQQINALVMELSGGGDLSSPWSVAQVDTALANLEHDSIRSRLTTEQYESLKAALGSMLPRP